MTSAVRSVVARRCDVIVTASAVAKIHSFHQESWYYSFESPGIALYMSNVDECDGWIDANTRVAMPSQVWQLHVLHALARRQTVPHRERPSAISWGVQRALATAR
jgi:hypothetical protein